MYWKSLQVNHTVERRQDLVEKIIDCFARIYVEKGVPLITEIPYRINYEGIKLKIGDEHEINCRLPIDLAELSILLFKVYKKYLKMAELNKRYYFKVATFNCAKITVELDMVH